MGLETELATLLNSTGGRIPLEIVTTTEQNWTQFGVTTVIALISVFFILLLMGSSIRSGITKGVSGVRLALLKRKLGENVLLIKHTVPEGLFGGGGMIDNSTLLNIQKALTKFKGKPFTLLLHTPGGSIFSSLFISRLLKDYPGRIRTIIPLYAMSGGTLLSLSTDEIVLGRGACLGPVDPQLGSWFSYGSANVWKRIRNYKGKKADDQSLGMSWMGEQYTKTIKAHVKNFLSPIVPKTLLKKAVNYLTEGRVEHASQITRSDLSSLGIPTKQLGPRLDVLAKKIVSDESWQGVQYT